MNRKLYVGNLSFQTTDTELQELFESAGAVSTVSLMRDRETGRARGFAFVEMASDADAQNAINVLNQASFGGRTLTVNEARPQEPRNDNGGGYSGRRRTEPRW
jgi:cold-inducible RNA-binding protein